MLYSRRSSSKRTHYTLNRPPFDIGTDLKHGLFMVSRTA